MIQPVLSTQQILDRSEVYSGVYGRASINLYAFNSNGNRGIACGLNNLQKMRDGEPLGGKSIIDEKSCLDIPALLYKSAGLSYPYFFISLNRYVTNDILLSSSYNIFVLII